jgi:hypothetical protein
MNPWITNQRRLGKLFKKKEVAASAKAQDQSGDSFPER